MINQGGSLDRLVRAELNPSSDGHFSLAGLDQADARGDRLVRRDARHRHRVAWRGQGEPWQECKEGSICQPAVKAASLAMLEVRTSC